ncbi:polygalacturonase inhibitor-like [Papaver somniferum]|uniref:polygalacturonase inhibitor-like n=1 Tax=Papaver somniferum TaxID=3469 RepID=UPI000E6FE104|nr:polygalacturonase inhibitor-like [Papaver somniferum]
MVTTTLISPSHGALGKCNPSDYKALIDIKKSLSPYEFSWELNSWVQNTDCCDWHGVICDDKSNRVQGLSILGGEISGQIPSSAGDLPCLLSLFFRNIKNITGSVPQSITKLKHLIRLDLSYLSLSGPVHDFLNQLTVLNFLDLSYNQFSGSIPPNLSDLKNIRTIQLDGNKLTGSIPESFGKFTDDLAVLQLYNNKLTGSIPKSLGALDFGYIDLSRNKLVGDASMLFNPNHDLTRYIDLSGNRLEFDRTKVKFPKNLNWLDISHNKIFGGIPEKVQDLRNLYMLKVEYNRLCGKIPTGGRMQHFDSTSFSHNKCLCGSPLMSCK